MMHTVHRITIFTHECGGISCYFTMVLFCSLKVLLSFVHYQSLTLLGNSPVFMWVSQYFVAYFGLLERRCSWVWHLTRVIGRPETLCCWGFFCQYILKFLTVAGVHTSFGSSQDQSPFVQQPILREASVRALLRSVESSFIDGVAFQQASWCPYSLRNCASLGSAQAWPSFVDGATLTMAGACKFHRPAGVPRMQFQARNDKN